MGAISESGTIYTLIHSLYDVRQRRSNLEKTEKEIMSSLKPLVDPDFDIHLDLGLPISEPVVGAGDLSLTRIAGTNRSISSELLLERGISPDIIA